MSFQPWTRELTLAPGIAPGVCARTTNHQQWAPSSRHKARTLDDPVLLVGRRLDAPADADDGVVRLLPLVQARNTLRENRQLSDDRSRAAKRANAPRFRATTASRP